MPHADICSLDYVKNIKQCGWGSVRLIAELGCGVLTMNKIVIFKMSVPVDESIGFEKSLKLALHDAKKTLQKQKTRIDSLESQNKRLRERNKKICNFLAKHRAQDIEKAFSNCQNMTHVQYIIDKMD